MGEMKSDLKKKKPQQNRFERKWGRMATQTSYQMGETK